MDRIHPAVVIVGFNRTDALRRILNSVKNADYSGYSGIPLIISIDKSERDEVREIASDFDWKYGPKKVIVHEQRLGLRNHVITCGDLTNEYGAVIILEDDLTVSPAFYDYAVQASVFYKDQAEVSGISLYTYEFCGYVDMRFVAIEDGYDNYFMQMASSWGQIWTRPQWEKFRTWYDRNAESGLSDRDRLPRPVLKWPESSWKKYFIKYMVEEGLFFVYPRDSLTTNFGDDGTHGRGTGNLLQVPILMKKKKFHFSHLRESSSVYDAFFEPTQETLKRFCPQFKGFDFECDFYGMKELNKIKAEHLFSAKTTAKAISHFGNRMVPLMSNVIFGVDGECFSFGRTEDFGKLSKWCRLKMVYQQQRILNGVTALALGCYRILTVLKRIVKRD